MEEKKFIGVKEVAELSGLKKDRIRIMAQRGKIPGAIVEDFTGKGKQRYYRFNKAVITDWVAGLWIKAGDIWIYGKSPGSVGADTSDTI